MSGPAAGQTGRSSTDSHPSATSSTTLNSSSSPQHMRQIAGESSTKMDDRPGTGRADTGKTYESDNRLGGSTRSRDGGGRYRRHIPKTSGGFLLETAFRPLVPGESTYSQQKEANNRHAASGDKGKGVVGADAGDDRKHKHHHRRHHISASSIGSSPLSREVITGTRQGDENETLRNREDEIMPAPPKLDFQSASRANFDGSADGSRQNQRETIGDEEQKNAGLDTESLQIVNLALNLNESRRRGVNAARLSSGQAPIARRTVSGASIGFQEGILNVSPGTGSLKLHLQQQRRISRNISPTPDRSMRTAMAGVASQKQRSNSPAKQVMSRIPQQDQEFRYHFSESTLARAEKARTQLDLKYEFRRLLQHLPPLKPGHTTAPNSPITNDSRSQLTRIASGSSAKNGSGRPYNPLQAIRNRNTRARERMTIDPEAEGWTDLEKVKTWVDTVQNESSRPSYHLGDRVLLPEFSVGTSRPQDNATSGQLSTQPKRLNQSNTTSTKPRRQRVDWSISPEELLADAAWLEVGDHKTLIEDRHNRHIFPSDNTAPRPSFALERDNDGDTSKRGTERVRDGDDEDIFSGSKVKLPSFSHGKDSGSEQGRQHRKGVLSLGLVSDDGVQSRRGLLGRRRDNVLSNDSSGRSSGDESSRDRRKRLDDARHREDLNNSTLEKQMLAMLEKEAREQEVGGVEGIEAEESRKSRQAFADIQDHTVIESSSGKRNSLGLNMGTRKKLVTGSDESLEHSRRASLTQDQSKGGRASQAAALGESMIQSTASLAGLVPSIAINLSPPNSRTASPARNSIVKAGAKIGLFRGKDRENATDNETDPNDVAERHGRQTSVDSSYRESARRGSSPQKKLLSRFTTGDSSGKETQQSDRKPSRFEPEEEDLDSPKRRGLFKGRRIEEIVRSEVSKVSDLIRKKDQSGHNSGMSSPNSSYASSSDSDDDGSPFRGRKRRNHRSKLSAANSEDDALSPEPRDYPKYRSGNLPSFTSPFSRGERIRWDAAMCPEADHISRQQMAQRDAGKPSRFLKFQPPKLDMGSPSDLSRVTTRDTDSAGLLDTADYSGINERRNSYGFGGALRNATNVVEASNRFNALLDPSGRAGYGYLATGLTNLGAQGRRRSSNRPGLEGKRVWSYGERSTSARREGLVTRRDIARVRLLLLSSGVKAAQIYKGANETRPPGRSLVPQEQRLELPPVPRMQEHILAAQILSRDIQTSTRLFEDAADHFRNTTAVNLHDRILALRERVDLHLSPMVRIAADDADVFSSELSTTHTLAVKHLNDSVDKMIRRRRRRLRMLRRWGYVMLEWTLLGVMWWVWFVVVIVRMVRGTVAGVVRGVKWLLWL